MKLLVVDSSGAQSGFAALEADGGLASRGAAWLEDSRELSRQVVLCLDRALIAAGWTLDDIGAVALAAGPGSWTGLRIGFSACKTLTQARGLPLIAIPTYDAIAGAAWRGFIEGRRRAADDTAVLAVVGPCRAGQTYLKLFQCEAAGPRALGPERIVPSGELAALLRAASGAAGEPDRHPLLVAGPDRGLACALLAEAGPAATALEPGRDAVLLELGRLALAALAAGDAGDPLTAAPLYLAPSAAERALLEKSA